MVKIIFVKNPFSPSRERVVKLSEATNMPLSFYVDEFRNELPNGEAYIEIDGRKVPAEYLDTRNELVRPDSFIVVMPKVAKGGGGKGILGIIAVVALSVVSFGVGGLASGAGMWGAGIGAWTFGGYLAAAAVMFLGGSLISRFMAPKIDTGKYQANDDPTYSWNGIQTMDGQGNGIAITYGKVKSGGQSIMKFTSNNGNDQYFNWLVAAGEGELDITDIKLNSNPIENYESVSVEIRTGSNDQTVISNFNDTILSTAVSYELSNNVWRVHEMNGNTTEGIIIELECQNGLYHANDDGSLGTAWIDIQAEFAEAGSDNWTKFVTSGAYAKNNSLGAVLLDQYKKKSSYIVVIRPYSEDDNILVTGVSVRVGENYWGKNGETKYIKTGETGIIDIYGFRFQKEKLLSAYSGLFTIDVDISENRISAAKAGNVRRQFRVDHLPMGQYKVRVTVTARSADVNSSRDGVKIWWTQVNSIVYDDFSYPGVALIGIKAKATSQLSGGQPQLEFIKERSNVWVWNPNAGAYEQKAANNPAWAAYDFLHGAEQLKNIRTGTYEFDYKGVPKELMLYEQFEAWAENCERLNLKINLEVSTLKDFWSVVNQDIAPIGRGMVVQFGTKYGCIYDHKTQPVQLFNMGNIIQGSFSLNYLSTDERADCIELTYIDAEKDYEKTTLTIYSDDYDSLDIPNQPTQITMNGISDYYQAYREGKYQLYCNRLLTEAVTFKADVEAISCMVGDVILVSHDVPQWSISGRVLEASKDGSVVLPIDPKDITMSASNYGLMIRNSNSNSLTTYSVASFSGDYGEIVVKATSSISAEAGDLFSLGKIESISKPFTVTSISRTRDLEYTISGINYAEGIFNENYNIPIPDYSLAEDAAARNVINLSAKQISYKNSVGETLGKMFISWALPQNAFADYFCVLISEDGNNYKIVDNTEKLETYVDTKPHTSYFVKVITFKGASQSTGTVLGPIEAGIDEPPPDVIAMDCVKLSTGTLQFWWDFEYPNPNDIAGFELRYNQGSNITWKTSKPLHTGLVTEQPFETQALRQGVHTVLIRAVDNNENYSEGVANVILNLGDPLEENVLYKANASQNAWSNCTHTGTTNAEGNLMSSGDSYYWPDSNTPVWTLPNEAHWSKSYRYFELSFQVLALASGQMWLKYDIEGPCEIEYRIVGKDNYWMDEKTPFWGGDESWARWVDSKEMLKPYTGKSMVNAGDTIQVFIKAPNNVSEPTVIKELTLIIDVPDRQEHFEDITVPLSGVLLPIATPNYYTTAVRIDAVQNSNIAVARAAVINRNPCMIKLVDINGQPVSATVDVTWQGFVKEVI